MSRCPSLRRTRNHPSLSANRIKCCSASARSIGPWRNEHCTSGGMRCPISLQRYVVSLGAAHRHPELFHLKEALEFTPTPAGMTENDRERRYVNNKKEMCEKFKTEPLRHRHTPLIPCSVKGTHDVQCFGLLVRGDMQDALVIIDRKWCSAIHEYNMRTKLKT